MSVDLGDTTWDQARNSRLLLFLFPYFGRAPDSVELAEKRIASGTKVCIHDIQHWHSISPAWFDVMARAHDRGLLRIWRGTAWWAQGLDTDDSFDLPEYGTMFLGAQLQARTFPMLHAYRSYKDFWAKCHLIRRRLELTIVHMTDIHAKLDKFMTEYETDKSSVLHGFDLLYLGQIQDAAGRAGVWVDDYVRMAGHARTDCALICQAQWHGFGGTVMALQLAVLATRRPAPDSDAPRTLPPYAVQHMFEMLEPLAMHLFTDGEQIRCIEQYTRSAVRVHDKWLAEAKRLDAADRASSSTSKRRRHRE